MKNKRLSKVLLACCAVALSVTLTSCASAAQKNTIMKNARTQKILGNQFRCGVYYYDTRSKKKPISEIKSDVNRMADMGFNYIYAAVSVYPNTTDCPQLDALLEVAATRDMAVRVQLGGYAYLRGALVDRNTWEEGWNAKRLADIAVPFIRKYQDHPQVIDFLVMEEPGFTELQPLHEYYSEIYKQLPDAPLMILYNRLEVSQADKYDLYPQATGSDIYPFRAAGNARTNSVRTPGAALRYFDSRLNGFQQLAQYRNQAFEAVFSSFAQQTTYTRDELLNRYYGYKNEEQHQAALERDLRLAKAGNRGFTLTKEGKIERWWRYFAPPRYVTAMAWIALANGADSEAVYYWNGKVERGNSIVINMLGADGTGTRGLNEFATFAKKIRPFGKLFRSATRDTVPFITPENGDAVVQKNSNDFILQTSELNLVASSFTIPGYRSKVVVLVNTLAGKWSDGKSPLRLKESDPFHINDQGELVDFVAITEKREVQGKVLLPFAEVTDLMTGRNIPVDANGDLKLSIEPGAGKILFFSPGGSNEAQKIMKEYLP